MHMKKVQMEARLWGSSHLPAWKDVELNSGHVEGARQ